jgi:hypothetical protein
LSIPITYSLMRYLTAKKSVDDRALNWQVWQRLVAALPRATPQQPLRILEVGAGIGSMVERLVAGDLLTHATYTAIDQAPTLLAEACRHLRQWARERGGSHPFGINCWSDADGEISDLHGFLHIDAGAPAMRRSTALIAFDAV